MNYIFKLHDIIEFGAWRGLLPKKIFNIVIEKRRAKLYSGKTEYYFDINFPANKVIKSDKPKLLPGQIVKIKV